MGGKRLALPVRLNYDDEARRWYVMSAPVRGVSSVVAECYSRSDADAVIDALNSIAAGPTPPAPGEDPATPERP